MELWQATASCYRPLGGWNTEDQQEVQGWSGKGRLEDSASPKECCSWSPGCWWHMTSIYLVVGCSLVLKNACICLRTSFSWVGNNPSLQIHSICHGENRAMCRWTCDPTDEVFSSVLMRQDLHVSDRSYLPWYEAYERSLALSSHLLSTPCGEGEPKQRQFLAEMFIKTWCC